MNESQPTRFDYALRDLLVGDHDLSQLDHEGRVILIAELIETQKAAEACGWHRHTGDWDWFVTINKVEGTNLELITSKDFFVACVDHASITTVRLCGTHDLDVESNYPETVDFNIDDLTTIYVEVS